MKIWTCQLLTVMTALNEDESRMQRGVNRFGRRVDREKSAIVRPAHADSPNPCVHITAIWRVFTALHDGRTILAN